MSMIVARMQKMKAENLIGIGNHNQRKTKNHSNPDIDTSLSELNYDLVDRTDNYKKDIENFINENKSTTRAVRKDAVLINEWIITSDRKFFENLSDEAQKLAMTSWVWGIIPDDGKKVRNVKLYDEPTDITNNIQEMHIACGHLICGFVEENVFDE